MSMPLSYQEAVAPLFGGVTALHFFRLGNLAAGDTVLVNGASGAVGTMAVFTIYLRQRGSPESKPVGAPHDETASSG